MSALRALVHILCVDSSDSLFTPVFTRLCGSVSEFDLVWWVGEGCGCGRGEDKCDNCSVGGRFSC